MSDAVGLGFVIIFGIAGPLLGGVLADRWQCNRPDGRMRLASLSIAVASVFALLILLAAIDINNKPPMIFCAAMMPLNAALETSSDPVAAFVAFATHAVRVG